MDRHLTVKEATELTGKSESTIKRLIREITDDPTHSDRGRIQPTHEELERRKAAREPYAWKIEEELLLSRYPQEKQPEKGSDNATKTGQHDTDRLITVLEKTISVLENELDAKNRQIAESQERQREQNLLMKSLQEKVLLNEPSPASTKDIDSRPATSPQQGSGDRETPAKKTSIWNREFHLFKSNRQ